MLKLPDVPRLLKLHDVTYVMVETLSHPLARLAMLDCLSKVEFGDVLLLTDKPDAFADVPGRIHRVENWPSKLDWCRANWFMVPPLVRTSHILFCQWDAGVWDPNAWTDDFLNYDYIGALWPWHASKRVGNSGFSLKSSRLARFIYHRRATFPCDSPLEDDLLCRGYRHNLEAVGFTWAPERLAHRFSYEGCGDKPLPISQHFGFHGAFNFAKVFDMDGLKERAELMANDDYIRNSYMMQGFLQSSPGITEQRAETEEPANA